jgi:hypothetical protein
MAIRSASDVFYTLIARLPLLLLFAGVMWVLLSGLLHLEMYSFGTEVFIGNHETDNRLPQIGGQSNTELAAEAIASGDLATMEAALDQIEASQPGATNAAAPVPAG